MKDRAFAKINLCLNVVKKRVDGYHELEMIMVPIEFYDLIEINFSEDMKFESNSKYLPNSLEGNTVLKVIDIIKQKYNIKTNFAVKIIKHIPTRAGLGGGSADAASTIRILNNMLHLHLKLSEKIEIAKMVGADVPFCIENKAALVKGIGENLEYFKLNCKFLILLVKPRKGISTKEAFEKIDLTKCAHPDCDVVKEYLEQDNYSELCSALGNSLEQPSFELLPEIEEIKMQLLKLGFDAVLMSGSGSTVFGITKKLDILENAAYIMQGKKYFIRKTKILAKK